MIAAAARRFARMARGCALGARVAVLGLLGIGLLGGLLSGLGAGCGSPSPAAPDHAAAAPADPNNPADNCTTADDCDLAETCCGCNNGGHRVAIRKDAMASFTASRDQRCAGVMCAHHISHDPSCDAEAICGSRNRCRVAPHMQHESAPPAPPVPPAAP
jgi:hypothetical protein